MMKSNLNVIRK